MAVTIPKVDFLKLPPLEVRTNIVSNLSFKEIIIFRQVSKDWSALLSGEVVTRDLSRRELKLLYFQDPWNREVEKFFIENAELLLSASPSITQKFNEFLNKLRQMNQDTEKFSDSLKCARTRFLLWKYILKKYPNFLSIESEVASWKTAINEDVKVKKLKTNFDVLHRNLVNALSGKKFQDLSFAWDKCYFSICILIMSLRLINKENEGGIIRTAIIPITSEYSRARNTTIKISKPLRMNMPLILHLLINYGVDIKKTLYRNSEDDFGHTYFHVLLTSVNPAEVWGHEKQAAHKRASEVKEVTEEIGILLLDRGVNICHGNIRTAGQLNYYDLAFNILKKRIELAKTSKGSFQFLSNMETEDPICAKHLLIQAQKERISLLELGYNNNQSPLYEVIYRFTLQPPSFSHFSQETWENAWIEVAIVLIDMGANPTHPTVGHIIPFHYGGGYSVSAEKTTPMNVAKEKNLTKLIKIFEGKP